jgi:hypothetical protein
VSGLRPDTARCLRSRTVLLVSAAASVANALERLCDSELGDVDCENATSALRSHLADVQVVVAVLDEALFGPDPTNVDDEGHVLTVSSRRWQRHRPSRRW